MEKIAEEKTQDKYIGNVLQLIKNITQYVDGLVSLASLELRLAVKSLFKIIKIFFLLWVCIITTWIGLMGAIITGIVYLGFNWFYAWSVVSILNLLIMFLLYSALRKYTHNLTFPVIRRQLGTKSVVGEKQQG